MVNRFRNISKNASRRLMVGAALRGAKAAGYAMTRKPGRGLSNTYEMSKDGTAQIASIRTTRDRNIAFPPLDGGTHWKTLDKADLVLISAVDNPDDPQNIDVYLIPGTEVRMRFDASYAARVKNGRSARDDFGMWLTIDKGNDETVGQVGHSLAIDYPAIARFSIDELEIGAGSAVDDADIGSARGKNNKVDSSQSI